MARQGGKGRKNDEASATVDDMQQNSVFGRYSEAEMLSQLKELALDPCGQQFARDNIRPLCNQILRVKKVMVLQDSEIPWRKRKLEQFVKDTLRAPSSFGVPDQQTVTKMSRVQLADASSESCLLNSVDFTECRDAEILVDSRSSSSFVTFDGTLAEKPVSIECSTVLNCNSPNKHVSPVIDSCESVNETNSLSTENPTHNLPPSVDYLNTPTLDGPKKRHLPPPCRSLKSPSFVGDHLQTHVFPLGASDTTHNEAPTVNCMNSPTLDGPKKRHLLPPRRSLRLPSFISDHPQKHVIPVGPRFQADLPEWHGPVKRSLLIDEYCKNSSNSKWLGTRVWPIEIGTIKSRGRIIGKGRPNSCSCVSPGSVNCIRRHIVEKRLILQCDLGPAFSSWKFDEMGDQILESWTPKEQQTFESVMKMRPSSNGNNFLKRALKCFRNKCRKEIVGYYFNVYIPQRMSLQTRSSTNILVDTDDEDESVDCNYLGVCKSSEEKTRILSNSKEVKARMLRRAS